MVVNSIGAAPINYGFAQKEADATGKEEFLELLVTQMQHQDPLNPMSNEDFVAQLAQFNSLEQMINLNDTMESELVLQTMSSASNLLGKEVDAWVGTDSEGQMLCMRGTVQEVCLEDGAVVLSLATGTETANVFLGDVVRVR